MLKACLIIPKDLDLEVERKLYMQAEPGTFVDWLLAKGAHYASSEELARIPLEEKDLIRKDFLKTLIRKVNANSLCNMLPSL